MKEFTIQLDDMACKWLEHISAVTGESAERVISNGLYHQMTKIEDDILNVFTYREK